MSLRRRTSLIPPTSRPSSEVSLFCASGKTLPRFGLKEVRLTMGQVRDLQWLFPRARFLFVYRDLFRSYLSCKRVRWYSAWPSSRVRPVMAFAYQWRYLLEGFLAGYKEVDGLLIKCEDLVQREPRRQTIAEHVGVERIDESVLDVVNGARTKSRKLGWRHRLLLRAAARDRPKRLGYR